MEQARSASCYSFVDEVAVNPLARRLNPAPGPFPDAAQAHCDEEESRLYEEAEALRLQTPPSSARDVKAIVPQQQGLEPGDDICEGRVDSPVSLVTESLLFPGLTLDPEWRSRAVRQGKKSSPRTGDRTNSKSSIQTTYTARTILEGLVSEPFLVVRSFLDLRL